MDGLRTLMGMARSAKRAQGRTEAAVTRRFREVMAGRKITQVELAEKVELSRTQLTRILNGHTPASFTEAVDIAHALGLELAEVVRQAEAQQQEEPAASPDDARIAADVADVELRLRLEQEAAGDRNAGVTGE